VLHCVPVLLQPEVPAGMRPVLRRQQPGGRSDAAKKAGGGAPTAGNTSSSQMSPGARATSEGYCYHFAISTSPPCKPHLGLADNELSCFTAEQVLR